MSAPPNGEFTFSLREKKDKNGNIYLIGGIKFINCVIFIRPSGQIASDGSPKWYAVVKPYTGEKTETSEEEAVWEETPSRLPPTASHRRIKP